MVEPVGAEVFGVVEPNILPPEVLPRLNNELLGVVAGLSLLAGVDEPPASFFAPKLKPVPKEGVLLAPAVPKTPPLVPAELAVPAAPLNNPPAGVLPVLAFAPKRLGVDAPEFGLDPAFAPKLRPEPPVFDDPKGLAPAVVPPPNKPPVAGFDVAGVDWPNIEEVAGMPVVPNRLPWLGAELPPPLPVVPKLKAILAYVICRREE